MGAAGGARLKETERMTAFHVNAVHVEVKGLK